MVETQCVGLYCLLCSELLEMDLKPSEENVEHWTKLFVEFAVRLANAVRHIVLIGDYTDSLQVYHICVIYCCHN